uniref:Tetratricopeptide repeat domain 12 n=2 Tax=Cyprinus carpio TaxID=7962 RepID=A0A8C1CMC4_CYPCA
MVCCTLRFVREFLEDIRKDAEEKRKMKEEKVSALRELGSEAFDYETAVRLYTGGLDQLRDMQALYTNRAQAFIKLKRYKEAISDCEWALRVSKTLGKRSEKCPLIFQCQPKQRVSHPTLSGMIQKSYLRQVDLEEKTSLQEKTAWEELQEGTEQAMAVPELLKKLDRPNEINLYYCGGLELLSQAIKDCKTDTVLSQAQAQGF